MNVHLASPSSSPIGDQLQDMLEGVSLGANRDMAHSQTFPPVTYVSQAFFDLEVEKVFKPGWVCIAHVSQLQNPGDYVSVDLFGEMLMAVRGRDGEIRVMSRICTHRWAPLAQGCGNAKLFSCPFHKWGFDLEGNLLGAPLMDQVEFEVKSANLPRFNTEVVNGFVYVNLSGDAAPLAPAISGFSEKVKKYAIEDLIVAGRHTYECDFNWKIVAETFMECYHHIAAHPETFESDFPARMSYVSEGDPAWTYAVAPSRDSVPEEKLRMGVPLLADDLTREEERSFFLYLIFPSHLVFSMADRVYWYRVIPVGPDKSILDAHLLVRPEAREMPDYDAVIQAEIDFMDVFNLEDIAVNQMQQRGARTGSAQVGRLSHLEKAIWQLSNYIRARVLP